MRRLKFVRRPFFAFLAAGAVLCGIFATLGFVPFGGRSLLINDLNIQYVEYLKYLHTVVTGQNSLTYAQAVGMGGDFLPIFSYYCSSPSQLLLAFLPNDAILISVSLATILKLSLSRGDDDVLSRRALRGEESSFLVCAGLCVKRNGAGLFPMPDVAGWDCLVAVGSDRGEQILRGKVGGDVCPGRGVQRVFQLLHRDHGADVRLFFIPRRAALANSGMPFHFDGL